MKTASITMLFLLTILGTSNAQDDFITTKSGETLLGEVFQPINPLREVQFKKQGESNFKTYAAADLKGYQIDHNYFTSCDIPAEGGSLFLFTLVNGAANLYSFPNRSSFYLEKDGKYYLLEKNERIVDGKSMEDRRYAGKMNALFADCSLPAKVFEHLKFTEESLASATQQYNTCRDPQVAYKKVKNTSYPIKIGFAAGVAFNKTKPNRNYSDFISGNFGYTTGHSVSADLTISHSSVPHLYLRPGVEFVKKHGGFKETFSQDIATNTINISFLQIPVRAGYVFGGKKWIPFLSLGMVYGWAIEREQLYERRFISSGNVVISEKEKLPKTVENGFTAEVGTELKLTKQWRPFFMYQFDATLSNFPVGSRKLTTHKALLGIRF